MPRGLETNCHYDTIRRHKELFQVRSWLYLVQHVGILEMIVLCFGMHGEDIRERTNAECICVHFHHLVGHCVT